jgi:hypothetical protein
MKPSSSSCLRLAGNSGHGHGGPSACAACVRPRTRAHIFVVVAYGRLVVIDAGTAHPSAATFDGADLRTAVSAAAVADRGKRSAFEALGEGAGYDFVPLSYLRRTDRTGASRRRRWRPQASSARWPRPAMGACRSRRSWRARCRSSAARCARAMGACTLGPCSRSRSQRAAVHTGLCCVAASHAAAQQA